MSSPYENAKFDPASNKWKMTDTLGYVRLYDEKPSPKNWMKYQFEHRVAAEKFLGRPLQRGEIVHHEDGNRSHNAAHNISVVESHIAHIRGEHANWRKGEKCMHFPSEEHDDLRARLDSGLDIMTTRIQHEMNKYKPGMVYDSPFGKLLVEQLLPIKDVSVHPNYSTLTPSQIEQLSHGPMEYLTLSRDVSSHEKK